MPLLRSTVRMCSASTALLALAFAPLAAHGFVSTRAPTPMHAARSTVRMNVGDSAIPPISRRHALVSAAGLCLAPWSAGAAAPLDYTKVAADIKAQIKADPDKGE